MEVKIKITVQEINDKGCWLEFCLLKGINEWAMNEGLMDPDEVFFVTAKEADKLGLLPIHLEQLVI